MGRNSQRQVNSVRQIQLAPMSRLFSIRTSVWPIDSLRARNASSWYSHVTNGILGVIPSEILRGSYVQPKTLIQ